MKKGDLVRNNPIKMGIAMSIGLSKMLRWGCCFIAVEGVILKRGLQANLQSFGDGRCFLGKIPKYTTSPNLYGMYCSIVQSDSCCDTAY